MAMLLFRIYIAQWLEAYEQLKGKRTFHLLFSKDGTQDGYIVRTNTGAVIEIFCKEIVYQITYEKWWARDKEIFMYHVYCNYSHDLDPSLKEKLSEDLVLTQILHPLSHRASHKKSIIEAYVDLTISKYLKSHYKA